MPDPKLPARNNTYGGSSISSYYAEQAKRIAEQQRRAAEQAAAQRRQREYQQKQYAQAQMAAQQQARLRAQQAAAQRLREQQAAEQKRQSYLAEMERLRKEAFEKQKAQKTEREKQYAKERSQSERFRAIDDAGYYNESAEKYVRARNAEDNKPVAELPYGYGLFGTREQIYDERRNQGFGIGMDNYGLPTNPEGRDNRDPNTEWGVYDPYGLYGERYGGDYREIDPYKRMGENQFNWNDGKKSEFMWEINPEINYTMPEQEEYPLYDPGYGDWGDDWGSYDYPESEPYEETRRWFESMLDWKI